MIEINEITLHANKVQIVIGDGNVMLSLEDSNDEDNNKMHVFISDEAAKSLYRQLKYWVEQK